MRIAIINPKGGVAKSTSITNLVCIGAQRDKKSLLIDLDPQGTSSKNIGVPSDIPDEMTSADMFLNETSPSKLVLESDYGFDIIPAGARQGEAEAKLYSTSLGETLLNTLITTDTDLPAYDNIFFDTPGHRSKVMVAALVACEAVIVPMTPSRASTDQGQAVIDIIDAVSRFKQSMNQPPLKNLGFFFAHVNTQTNAARENIEEFRKDFSDYYVADTHIPTRTSVEEAQIKRVPLVHFQPDNDAAQAYKALYSELFEDK